MSLKIGQHLFTGPFEIEKAVVRKNKAASVFAIVSRGGDPWDPRFIALAFGETGDDGVVFNEHPDCLKWEAENDGELGVYFLPEDELETTGAKSRLTVVKELINKFPVPGSQIPIGGGF